MKAVKDSPRAAGDAGPRLISLLNGGINFVLLGDASTGYSWYLPNVDGPEEHEDWVFHALRHGQAWTLEAAVSELAASAAALHPDSDFAKALRA